MTRRGLLALGLSLGLLAAPAGAEEACFAMPLQVQVCPQAGIGFAQPPDAFSKLVDLAIAQPDGPAVHVSIGAMDAARSPAYASGAGWLDMVASDMARLGDSMDAPTPVRHRGADGLSAGYHAMNLGAEHERWGSFTALQVDGGLVVIVVASSRAPAPGEIAAWTEQALSTVFFLGTS